MNQENKIGEYWKKILQYWAAFVAACGRCWEKIKTNTGKAWAAVRAGSKELLQKLAAWLLKTRDSLVKATASARVKGKQWLQALAAWWLGVREKAASGMQQLKARFAGKQQPALESGNVEAEALPAAGEPEMLPEPQTDAETETADAPFSAPYVLPSENPVEEPAETAQPNGNPYLQKAAAILAAIGVGIKFVLKWLWRLRKVFMAVPVIWAAIKFAVQNMERLPEEVGLDIQSTGEFARMISREEAVYWPLGITLFCLLLMFCSKKPILPWAISIFTLVLPWLIWLLNYYA